MKPKVYLAGPMTGSGNPYRNVGSAVTTANHLHAEGFAVYVPHLTAFWEMMNTAAADAGCPHASTLLKDEDWLEHDREWLGACQAMLRLPGSSMGADKEQLWAEEMGIPVFHRMSDLIAHFGVLA